MRKILINLIKTSELSTKYNLIFSLYKVLISKLNLHNLGLHFHLT